MTQDDTDQSDDVSERIDDWVCSVNIIAGLKQHILIDRGDRDSGSKWKLVVDDFKRLLVPFTRSRLSQLLGNPGE